MRRILHSINLFWRITVVGLKLRYFLWAAGALKNAIDRGESTRDRWNSYEYANSRIHKTWLEAEKIRKEIGSPPH